jgi:hypothetical protein
MNIIKETCSYNERRYGKPWIAKVTFNKTIPKFEFGNWIGQAGYEGKLILENVEEGEIVSRGQKDNRNFKNNETNYYIVKNGELESISKVDAYNYYEANKKQEPANELEKFSTEQLLAEINKRGE